MDARTLQILMDINAMQSFGTVQTFGAQSGSSSSSSPFTSMLEEMLGNSSATSSLLGTVTNTNSLQYSGSNQVFKPSTLANVLATQNFSVTTPVSSKTQINNNKAGYSGKYANIIKQAAAKYDLPERLISSIIQHESSFKNNTVSHAGARGLMQLMPGTAKFLGVKDSYDPTQNINGGAKYLRQMLNQFNGNTELALAAYNAGPGNVKKYGGIPPFKETQNYVKKVLNTFNS